MRFERVVHAGRDLDNRLCDTWRAGSVRRRFGWTHLRKLNAASSLYAILISVIKVSFRPDRVEEALSAAGEELLWLLWQISGGFDIVKARAAREPCEDDARSVGVPLARRFWCASVSSTVRPFGVEVLSDIGVVYTGVVQTCTTSSRVVESFELVLPRGMPQAYWSPASLVFLVPHFRELGLESLKVLGMDLQLCGLQVWCWLVSTVGESDGDYHTNEAGNEEEQE
ncbi:hypothetical protein Taro_044822 [Colocasia esculenta]|uniref:Uncharacterized protein n=1 Tax=Colocasia esculenta TaxID=4460 RepID=A0A843WVH9_COLES|nr:hypothetical protein [Colocasia esculenta]